MFSPLCCLTADRHSDGRMVTWTEGGEVENVITVQWLRARTLTLQLCYFLGQIT